MSERKIATEFTVQRSTWQRGAYPPIGTAKLFMPETGFRCCVGFFAQACGFTDAEIGDRGYLGQVHAFDKSVEERIQNSGIYDINDAVPISAEKREAQLTLKFAELGITIHFED